MRRLPISGLFTLAAIAAGGCGSGAHTAQTSTNPPVVQQSICPSQQQPGIIADFGHFSSVGDANKLIARARAGGFQGLEVQRRGCKDFAVVLRGLRSVREGRNLQREASRVGLTVTIDCRSQPLQGGLVAVFGHVRTARAARRLRLRAAHTGFKGLQVVQDRCDDWEVVLYGLKTAAQRRAFAREARSAGFRITYESG